MLYYAKEACMIDGQTFNGGDIVPASVLKAAGDQIMHLVRREDEEAVVVKPKVALTSISATALVNAEESDDEDGLPTPEQSSDADGTTTTTESDTTTDNSTGSDASTTSSTPTTAVDATKKPKNTK